MLPTAKAGKTRKMTAWNWFVLASAVIIVASLAAVIFFKPGYGDLKAICSLLGGIAWIFVLKECGVPGLKKHNLGLSDRDDWPKNKFIPLAG
jgi:hypothetical protein